MVLLRKWMSRRNAASKGVIVEKQRWLDNTIRGEVGASYCCISITWYAAIACLEMEALSLILTHIPIYLDSVAALFSAKWTFYFTRAYSEYCWRRYLLRRLSERKARATKAARVEMTKITSHLWSRDNSDICGAIYEETRRQRKTSLKHIRIRRIN